MAAKHEKGEDTSSSDEEEAGKEIPQHDADSIEDQQEVRLLDNTSSCLENSNQDDDNYPPLGWTTSGRRIQQCTDDIPTGIGDDDVCTTNLCEEEECRAAQENDYVDQLTDDINLYCRFFGGERTMANSNSNANGQDRFMSTNWDDLMATFSQFLILDLEVADDTPTSLTSRVLAQVTFESQQIRSWLLDSSITVENHDADQLTENINIFIILLIISLYLRYF
nr:uncharacterized protein LOC131778045 [Pocillopora verrucosa]